MTDTTEDAAPLFGLRVVEESLPEGCELYRDAAGDIVVGKVGGRYGANPLLAGEDYRAANRRLRDMLAGDHD